MLLYSLIYLLGLIIYLPIALVKRKYNWNYLFLRGGGFDRATREKLSSTDKVIWLHAVSVGEMASVAKLVRLLKAEFSDYSILFTTVTRTGNAIAKRLAGEKDFVSYLPWDLAWLTKRMVKAVEPVLFITVETEIWPNLTSSLSERGVPIIIVNGRISPRSYRYYRGIKFFIAGILKKIDIFCMQTEVYARRIISLGVNRHRVKVCGNLKFDNLISDEGENFERKVEALRKVLGINRKDKLFIAGSTHQKEEAIILKLYKELNEVYSELKLLLAPRHIERADEIMRLAKSEGFQPLRISQLSKDKPHSFKPESVFILDTIGDLNATYTLATVVFVGGSLVPRGGQNIIEPAIFKKAVLFGPHIFNFSDIVEAFLHRGAMLMVKDSRELKEAAIRLITQESYRKALGERAREVISNNQGASERVLGVIKEVLTKQSP